MDGTLIEAWASQKSFRPGGGWHGYARQCVFNLPRRHPHDVDGIADYVGGALLALGPRGIKFSVFIKKKLKLTRSISSAIY